MFQKNLVKILSISITIALLAFGLSQSGFQAIQVQNDQLSTQNAGSCSGNICHRVQIDRLILDDLFSYIVTSGDESGLDSNICTAIDHGTFGKLIVLERSKDQYFTTILAQKLSNLPISFGVRAGNHNFCVIDWLDAPRQ